MAHLLYFEFPHPGPYGEEAAKAFLELGKDIAAEKDLLWKVWTENPEAGTGGGVYLFTDQAAAERYTQKHTERLKAFGVTNITARSFAVNEPLSKLTYTAFTRTT